MMTLLYHNKVINHNGCSLLSVLKVADSLERNNPAKMNCDALNGSVDNTHGCKCPETEDYRKKITVQQVENSRKIHWHRTPVALECTWYLQLSMLD
jgi:hypothetical protein